MCKSTLFSTLKPDTKTKGSVGYFNYMFWSYIYYDLDQSVNRITWKFE